jgi:hypothetical protein
MSGSGGSFVVRCGAAAALLVMAVVPARAQAPAESAAADASVDAKITALATSLDATRAELAESRAEIRELRSLLESVAAKLDTSDANRRPGGASTEASGPGVAAAGVGSAGSQIASVPAPLAKITQDDWDVLNSRMEELRQTKVDSGSKFPLRLSGMLLMNTIVTSGRVDEFDAPTVALPGLTSGSTGFSARQSIVGIEGQGPHVFGADTSADVQADFFGGDSYGYGASALGLMRLRLARARFDWKNTSIIGGVDTPFFSPGAPTSYLTVAEPAFSASGNLWAWSPVVRVEQRIDTRPTEIRVEAGATDLPSYAVSLSGARIPTPGESSRQPAYAVRISANGRNADRPASIGVAGIYLTQRFPGATSISGGGGMVDWNIPFVGRLAWSGELFAGKGLDGFGALPVPVVSAQNYNQYIQTSASLLARMGTYGGWSQVKLRVNSRSEVNFAVGDASRDANAFRRAAQTDSIVAGVAFENQSLLVNYVYRPRSDLVFSGEYRRFRTFSINGSPVEAGTTGLTAGFIF